MNGNKQMKLPQSFEFSETITGVETPIMCHKQNSVADLKFFFKRKSHNKKLLKMLCYLPIL